ncbi:MAG: SRPBCC domain-containing protein [Ferruginibacter sp.]
MSATLKFQANINAPKEKVWEILWNDDTYRKWTAAFTEGSHAESDWKEGSKILFLDGKGRGMFSMIEKKIVNEQIIFKHLGEVKDGVEEAKEWGGARERYFLSEKNGTTELSVEMDSTGDMDTYFNDTFPKALAIVKEISEA